MFYVGLGLIGVTAVGGYWYLRKTEKEPEFENVLRLVDKVDETNSVISQLLEADTSFLNNIQKIRKTLKDIPDTQVLNIILSTPGGQLFNVSRLLRILNSRKHGYRVFIRKFAMSAGTVIALGAKEIVMMKDDSFLGKIDPSSGKNSMVHILKSADEMKRTKAKLTFDDHMMICNAKDGENEMNDLLKDISLSPELREGIRQQLIFSAFPHEHKFDFDFCKELGLPVRLATEEEEKYFQ